MNNTQVENIENTEAEEIGNINVRTPTISADLANITIGGTRKISTTDNGLMNAEINVLANGEKEEGETRQITGPMHRTTGKAIFI